MRVPVLTYHAVNIAGNDYATTTTSRFAADLRLIGEMGLRVVPLSLGRRSTARHGAARS